MLWFLPPAKAGTSLSLPPSLFATARKSHFSRLLGITGWQWLYLLRIELGHFSNGGQSLCHTQLPIQRDLGEKKSEEGLSVTGTVWQGLRDRGLMWSHGRDAPMPLSWSRRGEGETLKKELKNCVSYKAWVSGCSVNHQRLESWPGLPSAGAPGLLAGGCSEDLQGFPNP